MYQLTIKHYYIQEAQLMLTNLHDAFRGQSEATAHTGLQQM